MSFWNNDIQINFMIDNNVWNYIKGINQHRPDLSGDGGDSQQAVT